MKASHLLPFLLAALAAPAFAQDGGQCIVAGRLSDGLWAPKFGSIHLFGDGGRPIATPTRAALGAVRRATLDAPALLAQCNGDKPLAIADDEPAGTKGQVPAISQGPVEVEAVSYPKLRTGGELVELRVRVPGERVVMLTR